ncbi:hypothetical protein OG21DRAFT_521830 [Imleria badia]|nr:hypothetical protein OG21DRAFT_521830 [Imleria badia]
MARKRLQELKPALLDVGRPSVVRLENLLKDMTHMMQSADLNDMPYAFRASYHPGKGCLLGTRESFLRDIYDILNNPDEHAPRVCLLTGVAGSGKSTVAHSIAQLYDKQKQLGSSFFFSRTDIVNRNQKNLFSTIARDLSDHDPQYKSALWGIVKEGRALRTSTCPIEQIERFIIEPGKELHPVKPLVVVIDGLDESGDQASRKALLNTISQKIANDTLPTFHLRFLITARAEEDIIASFPPGPRIVRKLMEDIPQEIVDRDVERFIHHALRLHFDFKSPADKARCQDLVSHSQQLFQWASAACGFINGYHDFSGFSPSQRLDKILQADDTDSTGSCLLDHLYLTILSELFTSGETQARFRMVMATGTVLALDEPLPLTSHSLLRGGDPQIRPSMKVLGSLLIGVLDKEKPIRLLHSSFRDFLLHESRSTVFHVEIQPHQPHASKFSRRFRYILSHLLCQSS